MYPAGFFSLVSYLEERGVKTGVFNIAAKMVNDPDVDVARLIRQIDAKVYGDRSPLAGAFPRRP
jgi:hypothetical protein